jgi:hypothetical protein
MDPHEEDAFSRTLGARGLSVALRGVLLLGVNAGFVFSLGESVS